MLTRMLRRTMLTTENSKNKRKKCVSFNNALNCWVCTAWINCGYGIMTRYNGGNSCHSAPCYMKWWTLRCRDAEDISFYLHVTLKMETTCCSESPCHGIKIHQCWRLLVRRRRCAWRLSGGRGGGANCLLCLPLPVPILNLIKFN